VITGDLHKKSKDKDKNRIENNPIDEEDDEDIITSDKMRAPKKPKPVTPEGNSQKRTIKIQRNPDNDEENEEEAISEKDLKSSKIISKPKTTLIHSDLKKNQR